ncbi:MAG: hypothetical protein RL481_2422 [Pseudomonadota bacterium]
MSVENMIHRSLLNNSRSSTNSELEMIALNFPDIVPADASQVNDRRNCFWDWVQNQIITIRNIE